MKIYIIRCKVSSHHAVSKNLTLLCVSETPQIDTDNWYTVAWTKGNNAAETILFSLAYKYLSTEHHEVFMDVCSRINTNGLGIELEQEIVGEIDVTKAYFKELNGKPEIKIYDL